MIRRLLIYAHFDAQAKVRPFVLKHLRALKELGEVRFSSNARLPASEVVKVRPWASEVLLRENRGFDFGQWSEALAGAEPESWDEIVLTNSTLIGPLFPLEPIFERMSSRPCDYWGMTTYTAHLPHIQSYFVVFKHRLLQSRSFRRFFESVLPYQSKGAVIFAYEIGLSQFLSDEGFRGEEAFPREMLRQSWRRNWAVRRRLGGRVRRRMDNTVYYPDLLIEAGMPYVKVRLLERNPLRLNLAPVLKGLQDHGFSLDDLQ
jgi:lipopolysaccharide biosynthesis protein